MSVAATAHLETSLPLRTFVRGLVAAILVTILGSLVAATVAAPPVLAGEPTVQAVLFYSPSCPHCHKVITEDLPPIADRYGDQLTVVFVDVSTEVGTELYRAAVTEFALPEDRIGVPTLVVGDSVLVGSAEIPEQLPLIVEQLLARGGAAWPAIPGLAEVLPAPPTAAPADRASAAPAETTPPALAIDPPPAPAASPPVTIEAMLGRVGWDPVGNALAIIVLVALLLSLAWVAAVGVRRRRIPVARPPSGWTAMLATVGLVIAGYLASVEIAGGAAVCGPVGNCHVVHASEFARLFGIPIGILGTLGYACILACWLVARRASARLAEPAAMGIALLAVGGVLFSAYLTFLEPFVIGATCAWCLASALLMDAILVVTIAGGLPAGSRALPSAPAST